MLQGIVSRSTDTSFFFFQLGDKTTEENHYNLLKTVMYKQ